MSNSLIQDPAAQRLSSDSGQTLPCQPLQPTSDPTISKRVCFYKSGDYKFSGHRMVISVRTFKTFDALLDVLSKKVPLPFGVRTITTPRGTHHVKGLDDLYDGGCYVCSDQRRVKPLNLDEVNQGQVPWNTTRSLSTGRQRRLQFGQFGRRDDVNNRPARATERVAVRTPKRLTVIKNKDRNIKRTIVLQRRTAPTFDALLDYLSQILQFPVLKLFSMDGRRVDGLAALILCSGVVVAAGNEPFRLGNYSFHRTDQMAHAMYTEPVETPKLPHRAQNNKSISSGRGSRNFSLSSERYIVNHIKKSQNGGMKSHLHHHNESFDTEVNQRQVFTDTCETGRVDNEHHSCILPHDDDIEKSFCVNQDGSMTVEMKVRLTVKEEEMLHWTTTLSRTSLRQRAACASISESSKSSPDSNNAIAKDSSRISEDDTKEENRLTGVGKGVCFNDEQLYKHNTSKALGKAKTSFRCTPTPGRHHIQKKASVVKMVTESGVQESCLGHYSYVERSTDGEATEGYCVVRQSSSSSNRPVPKPRKTLSAGTRNKDSHSFIRSSGVAEVLQVENNGIVTETVMHIYENRGCHNKEFSNEGCSADSAPLYGSTAAPDSKPSFEIGQCSSRNDIDLSCQSATADTPQRLKEDMLSLSSESKSLTQEMNNLSRMTENGTNTVEETVKKAKTQSQSEKHKKIIKPAGNHRSSASKNSKHSSTDKFSSNATAGKKSLPSLELAKSSHKNKGAEQKVEKRQSKKSIKDEKTVRKDSALLDNTENNKRTPPKRQSTNKMAAKDNGHNVNTPSGRPQMKKNMSGILQPKRSHLPGKKFVTNPKAMTENRRSSPKNSDTVSVPSLNPTPSEIHQYVENWLENVSQKQMTYTEATPDESQPPSKVVFEIGGDSETEEKNERQINSAEYSAGDAVEKSPEAVGPKAKIKPVLQQLCFFIQCIRKASDSNTTSNLKKSNSLPDFSAQVASVFGSSCKAFLSFLSVMILRENLKNSAVGDTNPSRSSSEAMLIMESLHNISAIEDRKEQRASLTDLQSRASSQFTECWKDFQTFRGMLESEPPPPKVSETKFSSDIFSEVRDIFEDHHLSIDELMEELNMPQDLRADITSTIQQARSFYPVEESTSVKTKRHQSDSEKDVEETIDGAISTDPDDSCTIQNITGDLNNVRSGDVLEMGPDVKDTGVSQSERDVAQKETEENDVEELVEAEGNKEGERAAVRVEDEADEEEKDKGSGNEGTQMEKTEEEAHEVVEETEQEEVVENSINKVGERECRDVVTEHEDEESVTEEVDEEEAVENIMEEVDEEEEEDKYRMGACEEEEEASDAEVSDTGEERISVITGQEEDKTIKDPEEMENGWVTEQVTHEVDQVEPAENKAEQMLAEEERAGDDDDDGNKVNGGLEQVERPESKDEVEKGNVSEDVDSFAEGGGCNNMLVEASYLQQEETKTEHNTESPTKSSSEGQCESAKGYGTDNKFEHDVERGISLPHYLEISQQLLDFVNSAIQSSSLTFTYDAVGNIRLESDNARVVQTKQTVIPKRSQESLYGLRRLPSPSTSDLSDYRPETSDSGGYKTQDSEDIVTENEEEAAERLSPVSRQENSERTNVEEAKSRLSLESIPEGLRSESFSSSDSGTKASKEDLSYFSAASSLRADMGAAVDDGVFIDQGRWLLKENHLIRKSPPVTLGMYGDMDSASTDTGQENTSEDSPLRDKTQRGTLVAVSSSELEEMARPETPKCTYFNMPHGSDSDPFFDDSSVQSGNRDASSVKGRSFRVSPCIDTTKTWPNKPGSLSSFASVEFRMPDGKVHPEEDSPVVTRQRRTSGGGGNVLQTQESRDTLQLRCGQYCPIL